MKLIDCRICGFENPDGLDGICEICMRIKTPDLCDLCGNEVYDDNILCDLCKSEDDDDYQDFKSDLD